MCSFSSLRSGVANSPAAGNAQIKILLDIEIKKATLFRMAFHVYKLSD